MTIEISRLDIASDELHLLQSETRFLKLAVAPYLELLGVTPLPSQVAIINAINNPKYRFVCAAVSRRQGKTYIANIIGQLVSLVPGSNILIMSPNYSLSQISFDLQRNLIKHFDLEVTKDNAKDKVIELSNGSTVRMGSVNQVDSCVGRSYDLIIFDEAALADGRDAFNVALRPTLDKDNSKAIFISTPRGRNNWFAEFFDRGFNDEFPEWCSIRATYKDNPRMSELDISEAKNLCPMLSSVKSMKLTLTLMKDRYGTSIMRLVSPIMKLSTYLAWMYLLVSMWVIVIQLHFAS